MVLLEALPGCVYYLATVSLFQVGQGHVSKSGSNICKSYLESVLITGVC